MSAAKMEYRWAVRRTGNEPKQLYRLVANENGYSTLLMEAYDKVSDALEAHSLDAESFRDVHDAFQKTGGIYAKTYEVDGGLVIALIYKMTLL